MRPQDRRYRKALILVLVALVALVAPLYGAEEENSAEPAKDEAANPYVQATGGKKKVDSDVKVYRNEDLRRLYGGQSLDEVTTEAPSGEGTIPTGGPATPPPGSKPGAEYDPLKQMLEEQQQAKQRQTAIVEAESQVETAKQSIADLEKRVLATKNPFLARPKPPEEDASDWNEMSAPDRVKLEEKELELARQRLSEAQAELNRLRRTP